ncbi:hypothetical protein CINS5915_04775 [Campylobacter insulaenigrae]|uniref:Integral membrane protein n=1 Tax=Campylobacter insulaenigrae TaxID=260714 RepID=A0ABY3G5F4_9BACT|nr:hypothetical protein [Campylobacter insulaenigrae]MCR6572588.1 hypothetical protein [Campylobacter insulaenigrae]MCR6573926.1 hypothetical protein [Campylobacter insulaenigrae]MCR6575680.1 hypothetical protein [Campylobacter insulaenigrae]MCR6578752.1 hypothetical protein [Campylobacter insulaenigrae]MCR6580166.1 hypothetical protein [Campylobacter insulaenigrae]
MDQNYHIFLAFHVYSLYTSGFLMLFYLYLTQSSFSQEFIFIRRIRLFLPIYYLFLAIVLFTGNLLWALKHFEMNLYILLMWLAWIFIFSLAIYQFVLFKKARIYKRYAKFRFLSFFILCADIFLLFVPYLFQKFYF